MYYPNIEEERVLSFKEETVLQAILNSQAYKLTSSI